jgi:hypothetical protein
MPHGKIRHVRIELTTETTVDVGKYNLLDAGRGRNSFESIDCRLVANSDAEKQQVWKEG